MSGRFLLDSNIVIAIFAGESPVLERTAAAEEVFVPAVALGELYYGARKSARSEANSARIDEFAAAAAVLNCDLISAKAYGRIKNYLRAKGLSSFIGQAGLGDNDCERSRQKCAVPMRQRAQIQEMLSRKIRGSGRRLYGGRTRQRLHGP